MDIPYLLEDTNIFITSDIVERLIKTTHIFNNVILASKPRVIKALSKSDMAVFWVDIRNVWRGAKVKGLINRHLNISSYITTICGTNMNLEVSQYKNCWK